MKLAVSEIAWLPEETGSALEVLKDCGIQALELVPSRSFGPVLSATQADVENIRNKYSHAGFSVVSMQALLTGSNGLELFGDEAARNSLKEWLKAVGRISSWIGGGPMVFGSPINRRRGELSVEIALEIAVPFFRELGDYFAELGTCLVMEHNPPAYGTDFCNFVAETATLVSLVDSPGFALHIDAGGLALSGENYQFELPLVVDLIKHVHASQPYLCDFSDVTQTHDSLSRTLRAHNYQGYVSLEMKRNNNCLEELQRAIKFITNCYGGA